MSTDPEIVIVGAGFGGLAMAVELSTAGIADFVLLEQAGEDAEPTRSTGLRRRTRARWERMRRNDLRLPADVVTLGFDEPDDRWDVGLADSTRLHPRIVVLTPGNGPDRHIAGLGGLTLPGARRNDAVGFLGGAMHGFPNMFRVIDPRGGGHRPIGATIEAQVRYIRRCVELMRATSSTRMEVRSATQHEFNRRLSAELAGTVRNSGVRRVLRRPDPRHYELTVPADREPAHEYSGPAMLDSPGSVDPVTVTLSGHADPIDGNYHWYGRISAVDGAELPDPGRAEVRLTLPGRFPTAGRLQERDPWGNLRIVGVGQPPYPLEPVAAH